MASCTVSSASSRWPGPSSRVKCATIRPACRRNRCSSSAPVSGSELGSPDVPYFNGAAVLDSRMIQRQLHGFVVAGGFDGVVSAQHLFRFAVGAVHGALLSVLIAQHLAHVVGQALTVPGERHLGPGCEFLERLLHFVRAEIHKTLGIA